MLDQARAFLSPLLPETLAKAAAGYLSRIHSLQLHILDNKEKDEKQIAIVFATLLLL